MSDICTAAAQGNAAQVEKLLKSDRHVVNYQDEYGWSPLHFASR
jgi:ankyrin repeat protein